MALCRALGCLVDPLDIVNEFDIPAHKLSPCPDVIFIKILFSHDMIELLAEAILHCVC